MSHENVFNPERSAVTHQAEFPERYHEPAMAEVRSFSPLASIIMLQRDIAETGAIRPETWRQVYNEELTFIAEGLNSPLETEFSLHYSKQRGLVDERGKRLMDILLLGKQAALNEASGGYYFTVRRAEHDYQEGLALEAMMADNSVGSNNTVISFSPFPEEAYRQFGRETLESKGYQPGRQLGFMRIYRKLNVHQLTVASVSVDSSNLEAFRASAADVLGFTIPSCTSDEMPGHRYMGRFDASEQAVLGKRLRAAYDADLYRQFGEPFVAGRRRQLEPEAWSFLRGQHDVLTFYFAQLEALARNPTQADVVQKKQSITLALWATLKARLNTATSNLQNGIESPARSFTTHDRASLESEMNNAYMGALQRHEYLVACGGKMAFGEEADLRLLSPEQAFARIFSDRNEQWSYTKGYCRVDNCPRQERITDVGPCAVCRDCQRVFDKTGKPPRYTLKHSQRSRGRSTVPAGTPGKALRKQNTTRLFSRNNAKTKELQWEQTNQRHQKARVRRHLGSLSLAQ